jgi:transcriptional regulator with XRE-family HTH domain
MCGIIPLSSSGRNPSLAENCVTRDYTRTMSKISDRVEQRISALGLTARGVSLRAGLGVDAVRDLKRTKSPGMETISALARVLDCDVRYLLGDIDEIGNPATLGRVSEFTFLPIRYRVQAGHWLEMDDTIEEGYGTAPLSVSPAWANAKQWAEEIVGNSIDEVYPPGALAHVVDIWDLGREPRVGELVVVQRTRDGGLLRERTIKRLTLSETGQPQLVGCSKSEPKWNTPIPLPAGLGERSEVEVAIVGLVIGAYLAAPNN